MQPRRLAAIAVALVLATGFTFAQGPNKNAGTKAPPPPSKDGQVQPKGGALSIDVDLVTVDVVVTDKNNNPITGLEKQNFKVFDENVEQTISNFSPTDAPLTVVVVVEFGQTFAYYYDDVVRPAAGFIDSLRKDDWVALVAYDIRPEILTDFTKNKGEMYEGLRRLQIPAYREIALYDAVYDTLDRLASIDGKKVIFLMGTGLDTISKHSFPEALKKAESTDTVIYSVSMGQMYRLYVEQRLNPIDQITLLQADNTLRSLSEASGGLAFFPRFVSEYPSIYESVSNNLRNQYSLGFVPKDQKKDGKFHKLRIEVPNVDLNKDGKPDQLKVRHKKGYYAPKS
jgi:Ca-activated chloride channel homolog